MRTTVTRVVAILVLALAARSAASEVTVPFDVQVPLLLKALTYDRNLKARTSADLVRIAVLVPGGGKGAAADLYSSLKRVSGRTVNGLEVVFKQIDAGDASALDTLLTEGQWAAAYIMPGFTHAELAKVRRLCETRRVLPVAAAIDDLDHGLAFGVGTAGSRPQIVVNLPASKACGSDFDLALLQLSKVLR
jgi:hypothetical protein